MFFEVLKKKSLQILGLASHIGVDLRLGCSTFDPASEGLGPCTCVGDEETPGTTLD